MKIKPSFKNNSYFFSALQIIFLFFLQENDLRKALIPFIGVSFMNGIRGRNEIKNSTSYFITAPKSTGQNGSQYRPSRKEDAKTGGIFLIMTLLVLGFAPPCQALDIVFRSTATVSGPSVTLADIADFKTGSEQPETANTLSGQTVAASPDAGEKIVLDTRGIIHKLSQAGTDPASIQWSGAETVTVSRQGVTITPKIVQKIIDGFLAEHSKELSGISCSFTPTDRHPPSSSPPATCDGR